MFLDFFLRELNKLRIFKERSIHQRSIVLVTGKEFVQEAIHKLNYKEKYPFYKVSGIILLDSDQSETFEGIDAPVLPLNEESLQRIARAWIDGVFILQPETVLFPSELMKLLKESGITIYYTLTALYDEDLPVTEASKLGKYRVFTNSVRFIPPGKLLIKRIIDIVGGIIGCILTGIIFLFVAPIIYMKSPGPIFFTQERIGENGKPFKIHKFRTMYLDAEKRKKELMDKNKVQDGLMFKMDDDPRIIGSEKKNKYGKPIGIGNILRKTSLDEFPQFYDVLIGNMSLVGWRPCTREEWKKYNLEHRIRASMKPGITGMWQANGRSRITDFNEVVKMDREYLENWSLTLDLKILLKTIWVVLTCKGAE